MTGSPSVCLTVGVYADLEGGIGGGVNSFAQGLVTSLLEREDADLRYVVFLADNNDEWGVESSERASIVRVHRRPEPFGIRAWPNRLARYGAGLLDAAKGDLLRARVTVVRRWRQREITRAVAASPWALDILHFPFQDIARLRPPMIFSPWDLQHRHLKELWGKKAADARDAYYRLGCRMARYVAFGSEWARDDVVKEFRLELEKTIVVPIAPPSSLGERADAAHRTVVRQKYGLPARFMLYPAVTWKHKNHVRLLSAMASVKACAPDLHLICTGQIGPFVTVIMAHAETVGVADRVRFLGYVEKRDLSALYHLAEFCVYPSLFEGGALPVLEAFDEGCPLAASGVTCIPEYAGDAALLFDPYDVTSISKAITAMSTSPSLRRDLAFRGRERVTRYSWVKVGEQYTDLYRRMSRERKN